MNGWVRLCGETILGGVIKLALATRLVALSVRTLPQALAKRNRPLRGLLLKQIYFSGLESVTIILPVAMALGTIIITQIVGLVGTGNEALIGKVLVWTVVRELGPLLTAFIVIARSGAAIATELGTMKINQEIATLEMLGVPPEIYLVMPRIVGVTLSLVTLTVYFELGAVLGGFLVASLGWQISYAHFAEGLYAALSVGEIAASLGKSVLFGLLISSLCCTRGLAVGQSATQIPQAATKGVLDSLFLVVLGDGLVTFLFHLTQNS